MPNWIQEDFSKGQVNSKDPMELGPGEVQEATGLYYKPNDNRLHVVPGRAVFGDTGSAAEVAGVKVCQFDNGSDKVVALSGTTLYGATPGTAGTFTPLKTGLTASPELLSATHYNDKWYMTNGKDQLFVLNDSGEIRNVGLVPQTEAFIATPGGTVGVTIRPAAPTSGMINASKSVDSDLDTFGSMILDAFQTSKVSTWSAVDGSDDWFGADPETRNLVVKYELQNSNLDWNGVRLGPVITILFEISVDSGDTWTTIYSAVETGSVYQTDFQYQVTEDPDVVQFRVTVSLSDPSPWTADNAAFRIYDIRLQDGSSSDPVAEDTVVTYAVAEFDSSRGLQSDISPEVEVTLLAGSNHNQVTLDLSGYTPKNENTDYWVIYRKPPDGTSFGEINSRYPISQDTYVDDFATWGYTDQPLPVYGMLEYRSSETNTGFGLLREPLYRVPPTMSGIRTFKGHLIGWYNRQIFYSAPGLPEYWPSSYTIDRIPLEEHDTILDGIDLGDYFVFGCQGAMLRIDQFPIVLNGMFVAGNAVKVSGAPGCVGPKAMSSLAIGGQPYAAWISSYGIYATNGMSVERLSDDWNWDDMLGLDKSDWVLHWDPERFMLVMAYSSTANGPNDRYALIHMHPSHIKNGRPKITWGHYGAINDLGHGQVGNRRRLYSAHPSDGKVYIEDYGTTDAANTYDSAGNIPWTLKLRRMQGNASDWAALGVRLGHTSFGAGVTAGVAWKYGRDNSSRTVEETKTTTVLLFGHKRTLFDIGRGGEWHEPTFSYAGKATGALLDLQIRARALGASGKVSV